MDKTAIAKAQIFAPELPWNCRRADDLGPTIMKFMEDHEPFYKRWAETWFQNFQFVYGNQAIRWSPRNGYAVDVDFLQRNPAINMRAQTNLARTVAEALASMIFSQIPEWESEAANESSIKGKRFRRIIQKILDAYMIRLCADREFSSMAMIYTVYGKVGGVVDWNALAGKLLEIPRWQKTQAPVFTNWMAPNPVTQGLLEMPTQALGGQGQPISEERWEPVLDEMGRQIVDKMFAGDVFMDAMTPFEFRREIGTQEHKSKYWQRILFLDYDEALDRYSKTGGETGKLKGIKPIYHNPAVYRLAVRHFMRMQFTTPPALSEIFRRPENVYRNNLFKNKVLVVEHYDRPHPAKWPVGRRVVVINGDATHITVPSYATNRMDGWHPFAEAQWLNIPPSGESAGAMNDVVQKNRELNVADSLIATAMRRNMGSQLLVKTGAGIDTQRLTGEPGMVHEVPDPFGARWLHDDMPLPPVLTSLRDTYKDDVYEVSGAMDALRGDRTKGVSAGYALRQLQEREERRLTPSRRRFESFVSTLGEKVIICLKSNVVRLDDSVMGYLTRAAAGEFQPQDVVAFLSSPMEFGIEIRIKESSMAMRSKASQQATIQELGQNSAVSQRLSQDAKVLDEYLKYFDAETLRDQSATHRDRAQRENELFTDLLRLGPVVEGAGKPIVLFEDDDDIHISEHTSFLLQNSDEITRNERFLHDFIMHMETHRLQKQEKMGDLMPGTSQAVPQMAQAAGQMTKPTVQTIQQKAMINQQEKVQRAAQAPTEPAPAGSGGPPQTSTAAPSANTPSAATAGGTT